VAKTTVPRKRGDNSQNVRRSNGKHGARQGAAESSGTREVKRVQRAGAI
jgi:hypothetical protein